MILVKQRKCRRYSFSNFFPSISFKTWTSSLLRFYLLQNLESSSELKANDKSVETKPQPDAEVKVDIIPREAKDESNVSQANVII